MSLHNWSSDARLAERIRSSVAAGNVFHAYIIEGDTCVDKMAFAKDMLKAIICRDNPGIGCDDCIDCRKS